MCLFPSDEQEQDVTFEQLPWKNLVFWLAIGAGLEHFFAEKGHRVTLVDQKVYLEQPENIISRIILSAVCSYHSKRQAEVA